MDDRVYYKVNWLDISYFKKMYRYIINIKNILFR